MPDWALYTLGGLAVLAFLSRPVVMIWFPNSGLACWLDENWPTGFDSGTDCDGVGGDGGD